MAGLLTCPKFQKHSACLTMALHALICAFQIYRDVFRTREWDDGFQRLYKEHRVRFAELPGRAGSLAAWKDLVVTQCGLVCIGRAETGALCLVNLANKTARELPLFNGGRSCDDMVVAVAAAAEDGSRPRPRVQVLVLWTDLGLTFLQVYSSSTREWTTTLSCLPASALKSRHYRKPACVVCNGLVYVLVRRWRPNAKLLVVDSEDGRMLGRVELPHSLPNLMGGTQFRQEFPSGHNGSLFWTAQSTQGAISIWVMDNGTREWSGLCFSDDMADFNLVDVQLVGGVMFLVLHKPRDVSDLMELDSTDEDASPDRHGPPTSNEETHLLAYNIIKNSWYTVWQQPNVPMVGWIHLFQARPTLRL